MDLKVYYQKIKDVEAKIADEFPIVVSQESGDGGKAGVQTEVPRQIAAKLIVEGAAKLATPDEVAKFRAAVTEAKQVADKVSEAAKLQLTILSSSELEGLKAKAKAPGVKG